MTALSLVVLHVGHVVELTLFEYLIRVLLHLVAVGAIIVLVAWWARLVEMIRVAFSTDRGGDLDDR